ncbi:methyl-accepting chemotaxis protein [Fundidesulfovibrio agrisoli]|uniref:methyl-accepting chemotaxis protein n=1 Tax=Fundidesulfovibrio agrisoli TaxID=2922717 RepID=UPI001FAB9556|nr:methyl-accepting chemotaxis protein [Fundidesulfovibrio agrisoli]
MLHSASIRFRAVLLGVLSPLVLYAAFVLASGPLGLSSGAAQLVGLAAGVLAGLGFGWLLFGGVRDNLSEINQAMAKVAGGDFGARLPAPSVAELDALESSLDSLIGQLKLTLGNWRGFTEAVLVPYALVDIKGNLVMCNDRALEMLERGGKPSDYPGMFFSEFFYGDKTRKALIVDIMENNQGVVRDVEFKNLKGNTRFIQAALSPLHDLDGKVSGGLCMYLDYTEIRTKEDHITRQSQAIMETVSVVEAISRELASTCRALTSQVDAASRGARVQSERAEETAASMEEMNATVLEVARNAGTAAQSAGEAQAKAREGEQVVGKAVEAILQVDELTSTLKRSMDGLSERAEAIGRIMGVISDIADQTNLLALNAAIEAARAGDAGRGFAVVADEVRKLAEKTMTATHEVGEVTGAIRTGVGQSIAGTDQAAEAVQRATRLARESGEALKGIVDLAEATSDQVRGIAAAAEQQSAASDEIARAVDDVRRVSQETSQEMGGASNGVDALARLAGQLESAIRSLAS